MPVSPITSLSEAKLKLLQSYLRPSVVPAAAPLQIDRHLSSEPAPLSTCQEELVVRERSTAGIPPLYNECIRLRMEGTLKIGLLERSFTEIVRRHEIWRTSYDMLNGESVQVVHPAPEETRFPVTDLRGLPKADQEAEIADLISALASKPFDLTAGPLLRAKLIRTGDLEHSLYLIAHLSIVDGVSVYQVFPLELATLYRTYSSGERSPLPELPIQFGDYARWQRQSQHGDQVAGQLSYWRTQLASAPPLDWPRDQPHSRKQTFRGAIKSFALPVKLSESARKFSKQEGTTLFMSLLAVYAALLHWYSQQNDIVLGTPSPAGRKRSEVQKLLGYFLNPVALRFDFSGNPTFREVLRQAHKVILEAISNDDLSPQLLSRKLNPQPDSGRRAPLFTMGISLQPSTPDLGVKWSVTSMDANSGGSPWDLYLAFIDRPEGLLGRAQYNPDLFEAETIATMLQDYEKVFAAAISNPAMRLSETKIVRAQSLHASE